ncbi:MAG: nucleotidyltransferase [Treponema sp.]|jgi:predicted nucleotidyltransferase|nr:nucleotidyltransferase [Treponema sp.]
MMLNSDYRDILSALSDRKVKFLLVGAYAMAVHGYPRSTMDIDLWVMPDPENAILVLQALEDFGAPSGELLPEDLQKDGIVFQIGAAPRRIDILTSADGLKFEEAFANSQTIDIDGIPVHVLSTADLIKNKRSTGRTKDLADAESLEEVGSKH